jgi:hypothetical protein
MGLIQPCELRWALKSTRNQLLPGGNVLPAVVFPQTLRQWIRKGTLSASISLPFFSTISAGMPGSIQHERASAVQLSQNADLGLRRLLFLQHWDPAGSSEVLREISALLAAGLTADQLETLVLEILETGGSEGWLIPY